MQGESDLYQVDHHQEKDVTEKKEEDELSAAVASIIPPPSTLFPGTDLDSSLLERARQEADEWDELLNLPPPTPPNNASDKNTTTNEITTTEDNKQATSFETHNTRIPTSAPPPPPVEDERFSNDMVTTTTQVAPETAAITPLNYDNNSFDTTPVQERLDADAAAISPPSEVATPLQAEQQYDDKMSNQETYQDAPPTSATVATVANPLLQEQRQQQQRPQQQQQRFTPDPTTKSPAFPQSSFPQMSAPGSFPPTAQQQANLDRLSSYASQQQSNNEQQQQQLPVVTQPNKPPQQHHIHPSPATAAIPSHPLHQQQQQQAVQVNCGFGGQHNNNQAIAAAVTAAATTVTGDFSSSSGYETLSNNSSSPFTPENHSGYEQQVNTQMAQQQHHKQHDYNSPARQGPQPTITYHRPPSCSNKAAAAAGVSDGDQRMTSPSPLANSLLHEVPSPMNKAANGQQQQGGSETNKSVMSRYVATKPAPPPNPIHKQQQRNSVVRARMEEKGIHQQQQQQQQLSCNQLPPPQVIPDPQDRHYGLQQADCSGGRNMCSGMTVQQHHNMSGTMHSRANSAEYRSNKPSPEVVQPPQPPTNSYDAGGGNYLLPGAATARTDLHPQQQHPRLDYNNVAARISRSRTTGDWYDMYSGYGDTQQHSHQTTATPIPAQTQNYRNPPCQYPPWMDRTPQTQQQQQQQQHFYDFHHQQPNNNNSNFYPQTPTPHQGWSAGPASHPHRSTGAPAPQQGPVAPPHQHLQSDNVVQQYNGGGYGVMNQPSSAGAATANHPTIPAPPYATGDPQMQMYQQATTGHQPTADGYYHGYR